MEEQLHGRLTTLNKLKKDRDDYTLHPFNRLQADKAMHKIIDQLNDKELMSMRERLIQATRAGDLKEVWKIENQMRDHEGKETEQDE